jgi:Domain of unknown function (DUF4926)
MREFDVVRLIRDRTDHGMAAGAVGAIVHVFGQPDLAYEVEFCGDDGRTIARLALAPDEIEQPDPPPA